MDSHWSCNACPHNPLGAATALAAVYSMAPCQTGENKAGIRGLSVISMQ
jgi:hypothetical protein